MKFKLLKEEDRVNLEGIVSDLEALDIGVSKDDILYDWYNQGREYLKGVVKLNQKRLKDSLG